MDRLIWPNPIPNSNTWVHHPLWSFCQCYVWFDPIWCPISKYEKTSFILSVNHLIWPNPIPNSNTWVHHPRTTFCWCIIVYDQIQYPIPIHGNTTRKHYLVDVSPDMTQSNTQFQYMGTPPMKNILLMYRLIWPNPIPNFNTWVHHPRTTFGWCIVWFDPIQYQDWILEFREAKVKN